MSDTTFDEQLCPYCDRLGRSLSSGRVICDYCGAIKRGEKWSKHDDQEEPIPDYERRSPVVPVIELEELMHDEAIDTPAEFFERLQALIERYSQ